MLRKRILAAATASILALGMSMGGAGAALANPNADTPRVSSETGIETYTGNGLTCNDFVGVTQGNQDRPDSPGGVASINQSASWGTVTATATTVSWNINDGWTVDICVKGSTTVVWLDDRSGAGSYNFTVANVSHINFMDPQFSPQPKDKVVEGDWIVGQFDCDDTQVTETRTVSTTPYVWVAGAWVEGETVESTEEQVRDLTEEELASLECPGEQPEDKVVRGDWVAGQFDCDDTQVTETRTVSTTSYVLVEGEWVEGETVESTEEQVRDLTEEELASLECPGEQPEDKVVRGDWVAGQFDCDDTQVTETRTVSTTSYVLVEGEWVEGETVESTEEQVRDLTEEELASLECDVDDSVEIQPMVTVTPFDCETGGSYELPFIDGVIWTVGGEIVSAGIYPVLVAGTMVNVEASIDPTREDLVFADDVMTEWTLEFNEPETECGFEFPTFPLVSPSVTSTQPNCDSANGSYTLSATEGVTWFVNGVERAAGTYQSAAGTSVSIEAVANEGFGFGFEQQTEWDVTFTAATDCELPELETLALTGVTGLAGTAALVALLITLTGVGMVAARRRVEV